MTPFGWANLGVLVRYLSAFVAGSTLAAKAAGRSVRLFGHTSGTEARPALGVRLAFGLAFFDPLVLTAAPRTRPGAPRALPDPPSRTRIHFKTTSCGVKKQ